MIIALSTISFILAYVSTLTITALGGMFSEKSGTVALSLEGCMTFGAFSAGVGENSIRTRTDIMEGLKVLGIIPDYEANNVRGEERLITTPESKIPCYIVPTDEELMIARDTYNLCK